MKNIGTILFEAIKSLFKKPATSQYPYKKRDIHGSFAGMISFEQDKCIGCQICVRSCPAKAIKISKVNDEDKIFSCELSLANCIFCSQCVLSCPKKALHTTDNFELAQIDKSKLTVKLEELSSESDGGGKSGSEETGGKSGTGSAARPKQGKKTTAKETKPPAFTVKLEELSPANKPRGNAVVSGPARSKQETKGQLYFLPGSING
ncbi:MAG: 4Fe-4S binding protein [Endomicrobia bacterium]|nr:4Fe-4S binding protein [Endomicrobiia bacterium]MCL2799240.1 4Fe-4S binding protein [Endomicrobiia bacterium]